MYYQCLYGIDCIEATNVKVNVRLATTADAPRIRRIYAPHVRDSAVSFEREVPTGEDVEQRIGDTLESLPWLVAEREGEVAGYAYAHAYRSREAYQWSVESTVYVDEGHRRSGVARGLYTSLFEILRRQGYLSVYAGITLPNPASVGFHEATGFEPVGVYEHVGFKDGAWHDVGWWYRPLGEYPDEPDPPTSVGALRSRGDLPDALSAGESSIWPAD